MGAQFVIAVQEHEPGALRARVAQLVAAREQWWEKRRDEKEIEWLRGLDRREALRELQVELAELRAGGQLLDTQISLLTFHVGQVLAGRGWDKSYDELPAGQRSIPGRPVGLSPDDEERGGKGRLAVDLADDLDRQVRQAAYWESEPAVRELLEWDGKFGRGPAAGGMVGFAAELRSAMGHGPKEADLKRRRELRLQVVTVGDILRAGLRSALR